jgi:hypothetical protein
MEAKNLENYWTIETFYEYKKEIIADMEKSKLCVKKYHMLSTVLLIACVVTLFFTWFSLIGIVFSILCLGGTIISRSFKLKHKTIIIVDVSILVVPYEAYL